MDGWNTIVSFWDGIFSGPILVSGSVHRFFWIMVVIILGELVVDVQLLHLHYTPEFTNMTSGKYPFSLGNTSSFMVDIPASHVSFRGCTFKFHKLEKAYRHSWLFIVRNVCLCLSSLPCFRWLLKRKVHTCWAPSLGFLAKSLTCRERRAKRLSQLGDLHGNLSIPRR